MTSPVRRDKIHSYKTADRQNTRRQAEETDMSNCFLCPKECGADRDSGDVGFCGVPHEMYIAKIMLHKWEEPCICQKNGAGAIFFSGCNLHCIYCQNSKISGGKYGNILSEDELVSQILRLQNDGASCIELITPTHYTDTLARVLSSVKPRLDIPVVWNSGGYEKPETLKMLNGLVDIYLPDLKYFSKTLSEQYSHAPDYFDVAIAAISEMLSQTGAPVLADDGRLLRGTIVRHLVLPGCRKDSIELLSSLAQSINDPKRILLSLMSQYTPSFYIRSRNASEHSPLTRKITDFEYKSVLNTAISLGFEGYFQDRNSADESYTPNF